MSEQRALLGSRTAASSSASRAPGSSEHCSSRCVPRTAGWLRTVDDKVREVGAEARLVVWLSTLRAAAEGRRVDELHDPTATAAWFRQRASDETGCERCRAGLPTRPGFAYQQRVAAPVRRH